MPRTGALIGAVCLWILAPIGAPSLGFAEAPRTFEIEPELARTALGMQSDWSDWRLALADGEFEAAQESLESLQGRVRRLQVDSAPEFAIGAAFQAVELIERGELEAAAQAIEAAKSMASGVADVAFAEAWLLWREGRVFAAAGCYAKGCFRLVLNDELRVLSLANLSLALLFLLYCTVGVFGLLQLAVKGPEIVGGIEGRFAALPLVGRIVLCVLVLMWPVALPGGLFWVGLYWCVLFWKRQEISERAVVACLILLVMVSPFVLDAAEQRVRMHLFSDWGLVNDLEKRVLRTSLPQDLEALMRAAPDSDALLELAGEVHAAWGQPRQAVQYFEALLDKNSHSTGAHLGLGNFSFEQGNFNGAIEHYTSAIDSGAPLAPAHFNLSQAYNAIYAFDQAEKSLEKARRIDDEAVSRWIRSREVDRIVPVQLWQSKKEQILAAGRAQAAERDGVFPLALHALLSFSLVLLIGLGLGRWLGFEDRPRASTQGWLQFVSPGLRASQDGEGLSTLAAVLPLATIFVLLTPIIRYWLLPVSLGPGMPWRFALAGLVLLGWLISRLRWVF